MYIVEIWSNIQYPWIMYLINIQIMNYCWQMTGFLWWQATSLKPGRPWKCWNCSHLLFRSFLFNPPTLTIIAKQFSFPSALFGCLKKTPKSILLHLPNQAIYLWLAKSLSNSLTQSSKCVLLLFFHLPKSHWKWSFRQVASWWS